MNDELEVNQNTGYIPYAPSGTDYIKGENSPLGAVIPIFDWRTVRPALDLQKKNNFESFGCVSWAAVECVEEYINMLRRQGILPQSHEDYLLSRGFIVSDLFVASKAFIWVLSRTQEGVGNDFKTVADTIRHFGLIPESSMPFEPQMGATWEQVFVQPTQLQLQLGAEFLTYFDIGYHFLSGGLSPVVLQDHIKDGPIQIAIGICQGYNTDTPVKACGARESHSVLIDYIDNANEKEIVDHYNPEVKLLSSDYPIPASMQYVVAIKKGNPMQIKTQNKGGELSIQLAAANADQWAALCAVFGIDPNAPINQIVN